jgi:hypothetical protein
VIKSVKVVMVLMSFVPWKLKNCVYCANCASHLNDLKGLITSNGYFPSQNLSLSIHTCLFTTFYPFACILDLRFGLFPLDQAPRILCYANSVVRYANTVQISLATQTLCGIIRYATHVALFFATHPLFLCHCEKTF